MKQRNMPFLEIMTHLKYTLKGFLIKLTGFFYSFLSLLCREIYSSFILLFFLIIRYVETVQDPESKERWAKAQHSLATEFDLVKQIACELGNFDLTPPPPSESSPVSPTDSPSNRSKTKKPSSSSSSSSSSRRHKPLDRGQQSSDRLARSQTRRESAEGKGKRGNSKDKDGEENSPPTNKSGSYEPPPGDSYNVPSLNPNGDDKEPTEDPDASGSEGEEEDKPKKFEVRIEGKK